MRRAYLAVVVMTIVGFLGASVQPGGTNSLELWRYMLLFGVAALVLLPATNW